MNRTSRNPEELPGPSAVRRQRGIRSPFVTWAPTVIYIAAILLMAARPAPGLPRFSHADKYFHAAAYCALALLSFRAFFQGKWKSPFLWALILGAGVGASDEIVQYLGRVRTADVFDWYADVFGSFIGGLAARGLMGPRKADPLRDAPGSV